MRIFKGIAASEGLAKGKALVHHHASMTAEKQHILADGVSGELEKFRKALQTAKHTLQEHNASDISKESRDILETHLLMLEDPEYTQQIEAYITTNLVCAQWAIDSVTTSMVTLLEQTDDELLRERAVDFKDVSLYLIDAIKGKGQRRMEHLGEDVILVADILMPSELFAMDKTHILGICLDGGGRASHVAILVRAFNIPTVLAAGGASKTVNDGDEIIVDGTYGEAFIRPDHTVSQMLDERYARWQQHEVELHQMAVLSSTTTDGHEVLLKTNIQTSSEVEAAKACGASGIGLFRSEFLFMESLENPSE
ncbi:phosphoenolpyruvate-utilizing N-terminal domain-containing protein, partial [Sphaerochaeta sp.]